MTGRLKIVSALLLSGWACTAALAAPASPGEGSGDQITVVIPALSGPDNLGRAVSQIMQLKISQSFRMTDETRPGISLGRGAVRPVGYPLVRTSHEEAERVAHVNGAQLVLWGTALPFKTGATAQTYLTISEPYKDFRLDNNEVWKFRFSAKTLELDLPRRRISFPPIAITENLVRLFSSGQFPKICRTRDLRSCVVLQPEAFYRVHSWEGDNLARVVYENQEWWLSIPALGNYEFQTTNYAIGVIAHLRGDWNLVLNAMSKVLNGPPGTTLKIDAHIYRGVARDKMRQSGLKDFEEAYALGPYSVRSIQFLTMGLLKEGVREDISDAERRTLVERAQSLLNENRHLFLPNDPWRAAALKVAELVKERR